MQAASAVGLSVTILRDRLCHFLAGCPFGSLALRAGYRLEQLSAEILPDQALDRQGDQFAAAEGRVRLSQRTVSLVEHLLLLLVGVQAAERWRAGLEIEL